jgi:Fur family transcriptional regulator, ferric uptake regulator
MNKAIPEKILDRCGLKVTPNRKKILAILISNLGPIDIEGIRVKSGADAVTIYRTLDRLVRAGIIYRTDFREGKSYFEYQKKHHHHISCTSCGRKDEVGFCLSDLSKVLKESKNFKSVDSHVLEFFGVCKKCQS